MKPSLLCLLPIRLFPLAEVVVLHLGFTPKPSGNAALVASMPCCWLIEVSSWFNGRL
jgi:hypothetical protein